MATILIVDDELGSRSVMSDVLTDEGHSIVLAENAAQARACCRRMQPELVLLDIWMPDVDGITLLKEWSDSGQLTMPVIMLSGHGSIDTAVNATKFGATAFLEKPISLQKLLRTVEQSLANRASGVAAVGFTAQAVGRKVEITAAAGSVPSPAPRIPMPRSQQSFDLNRPLREAREAFEKNYFEFHLAQESGSITRVAEKTGIERTHLYRKLKQLGLDSWRPQNRQSSEAT